MDAIEFYRLLIFLGLAAASPLILAVFNLLTAQLAPRPATRSALARPITVGKPGASPSPRAPRDFLTVIGQWYDARGFSFARRMKFNGNIFLVGPMGAGKTTIGRLLAKTLGVAFFDSDKEIEQRTGVSIPMIFEYEGESGFRKRESDVLATLTQTCPIVLATGGGAILRPANRDYLGERGFVVYLQCPVEKQMERTHKDTNRPLLKTENPRARLEELLAERDPLYRDLADVIVDTGHYSSRSAVRQILKAFNRSRKHPKDA